MLFQVNWSKCPVDYMVDGMRRYVEHGVPPGHFLTALLSNDLKESFNRADDANTAAMRQWVIFLRWELPVGCQGSPAKVRAWIDQGGLRGATETREVAGDDI